jgi:uncharacterized membrane protein YbaN (DUF454 family)
MYTENSFERFKMDLFKKKVLLLYVVFLLSRRYLLDVLIRSVGIGLVWVGTFGAIPGNPVPTIPFLILASLCFQYSSPDLHYWLRNVEYLGPELRNWQDKKQISVKAKCVAVTSLMVSFIGVFLFNDSVLFICAFFVLVSTVSVFILTRKSG